MTLSHLKYVVEIEKTGSITKASNNLFMGQPNLSKAIKELENELGIEIFKRTSKGVQTTPNGKEFIMYAKKILYNFKDLENMYVHKSNSILELSLNIPRCTYISFAFAEFIRNSPQLSKFQLYIKETDPFTSIEDLHNGECDIAIVRYQYLYQDYLFSMIKERSIEMKPLWNFKCGIIISEESPITKLSNITSQVLSSFIEVSYSEKKKPYNFSNKNDYSDIFNQSNNHIYICDRASQFEIITQFPNTFMWTAPIPKDFLKKHKLVFLECKDTNIIKKDILIYNSNHKFSEYEKSFLKYVRQQVINISPYSETPPNFI